MIKSKSYIFLLVAAFFCFFKTSLSEVISSDVGSYQGKAYQKYRLNNGLTIILSPQPVNTAFVAISYKVGSQSDPVNLEGLSHFVEHFAFRPPKHFNGHNYFLEFAEQLGNYVDGSTGLAETEFAHSSVPPYFLERIIWLEAQRMGYLESAINQEHLALERPIIIREIAVKQYPLAALEFDSAVLSGNSHGILGDVESVNRIKVDDVKRFYQTYYRPNNAVLLIAGEFDEYRVLEWIDRYFSVIQPYQISESSTEVDNLTHRLAESRYIYHVNAQSTHELNIAYLLPPVSDSHSYIHLAMLSEIIKLLMEDGELGAANEFGVSAQVVIEPRSSPRFELTFRSEKEDGNLPSVEVQHQVFLEYLSSIEVQDIEAALEKLKTLLHNDRARDKEFWRRGVYNLLTNEIETGSPGTDILDIALYDGVSADQIIADIHQFIVGQPAIYQSLVQDQSSAYKPDGKSWYIAPERSGQSSPIYGEISPKLLGDAERYKSLPPLSSIAHPLHIPTVWSATLTNGIPLIGMQQTHAPLTSARLIVGNVSMKDDARRQEAISELAERFLNRKFEQQLDSKLALSGGVKVNIDVHHENIVLSLSAFSDQFLPNLKAFLSLMLTTPDDESLFVSMHQELLDESVHLSLHDFVNQLFFADTGSYFTFSDQDMYELFKDINWPEVKSFIDQSIYHQLNGVLIVSDRSKQELIAGLGAIDGIASASVSPFEVMPNETPVIDLKRGIHVVLEDREAAESNVEITVISHLPNDDEDARYDVHNQLFHHIYRHHFVSDVLREQLGLAYSPTANRYVSPQFSQLWTEVEVSAVDGVKALSAIHGFYKRFRSAEPAITQVMVDGMRAGLQARPYYDFYQHDEVLNYLFRSYNYPNDINYMQQRLSILSELTEKDMNQWAKAHMKAEELVMLVDYVPESILPQIYSFAEAINYPVYIYRYDKDQREMVRVMMTPASPAKGMP